MPRAFARPLILSFSFIRIVMTFELQTKKRNKGDAVALRASGRVPSVLYGPGTEPVVLSVERVPFEKLYHEAGESSLVDLSVEGEGEPSKVLIQDVQYDPVKQSIIHVDFRRINMREQMHATIELEFVGESMAVKALGGTLQKGVASVDVKCLPKDLVSSLVVDVSVLKTFTDFLYVKDLVVPPGIEITSSLDELVVKVSAPLSEEQLKAMEESQIGSIDTVEVEAKKKEEEAGEAEAEAKKANE
ncbi:MAG TPA: 50S ribosomal protein L25 [Candidatus Magasanikbacteria bacterium]|nr:50S ribosomal protein L25 [Candidatus Magasanikbacteria bacterium]